MPRQIRLTFPESGQTVIADLQDQAAPDTCEAIWELLAEPLRGPVNHARGIGPEIYVMLPALPQVPEENMTVFPVPGDLLFYHYVGQLPRGEVIYDIGMYYDRGGHSFWDVGWVPGNVFATVTGNLAGLQRAGGIICERGEHPAIVERAS